MKPLYLKIAGLNSFREEQAVNFTALGESGVFGIFGPTGSGKSTVLDAVTLALYGKVERAKGGTQGIINQNEDKLSVHFTFQVGDKRYTAERTYKRGNDGSINQYSCRFLEIGTDETKKVLAEKKREMDEKIQEVLGLTVDDFTRAVVLPQGKFQEFLTLQGADRRKMLQRIFALEKYGEQLVKKIREKVTRTQAELEKKQYEQNVLGDASEAAIAKAKKAFQEKKEKLAELEQKLASLHEKWEEYKEIRQLTQDLTAVEKGLTKLASEEPETEKKAEKLDLAQKAEYLRPYLKQVTDGEQALYAKEQEIGILAEELKKLESHCAQVEAEYKAWESKYQNEGKVLEGRLIKLEGALEDEKTRDGYNEKLLELRNEYRRLDETLKALKEEISGLENRKKEKERERNELDEKLSAKEKIVAQGEEIEKQKEAWQQLVDITSRMEELDKELNGKGQQLNSGELEKDKLLAEIQAIEKNLAKIQGKIEAIPVPELGLSEIYQEQTRLQSLTMLIDAIKNNENKLENKEKELEANKKLLLEQEKLFTKETEALKELDVTRSGLINTITLLEENERELERKNYAVNLRKTLKPDRPCPVCGSLEHPAPFEPEISHQPLLEETLNRLGLKKEELAQVEEKIQKQSKVLANTEAYLQVLREKAGELENELKELRTVSEVSRSKLPPKWVTEKSDTLITLLKKEEVTLKEKQKALEDAQKAKEQLQKEIQENEKNLNELRSRLSAISAELTLIRTEKEKLEEKRNSLLESEKLKREHFSKLTGGKTGKEVEELFTLLKTARVEMQKLQHKKNQVLKEWEDLNALVRAQEKTFQEKEQDLKVLENNGRTYRQYCDQLTAKINPITGGEKAQQVKARVEAELQTIVDSLNKYKAELEKSKNSLNEKTRVFHITSQEITNLKNDLKKQQEALEEKMAEYRFVSLGQLQDALCTEEERRELAEAIKKFTEEKLLAQERKKELLNKLANRSLTEEQWQEFLEHKSQVEAQEKQERQESYRLEQHLAGLEEKKAGWLQLEREIKELTGLLDQLARLDKLFKGNTFVEFIAEEQLMHVAIDASRRLGELTNYRYALEVDSEGGFIIRDDANGGLKRPVTTLSGGETFLTSLALALALSSQIQLRGKYPLEFFFLDEGFGTLDNYLLETVMNSLERLHLEKMTIGIISHVPELKARMPRSLIVEPAEKGGRGTRLRMEIL